MLMDEKKNPKKKKADFRLDPHDIEKFFQEFFENFVEIPFPPTDSDIKDFNYSFKFNSADKDNPEIKFNGSNLNINKIKEFLSNNLSDSVFNKENPEIVLDARDISIRPSNSTIENQNSNIEPMYDIFNDEMDNSVEIVMELPGVSEKNLKIYYLDQNEIIILGENQEKNSNYRKSFTLKFIPDRSKTEISSINNIFRIIIREGGEK
jgi:HSP20 family molecular chaperone IbpA